MPSKIERGIKIKGDARHAISEIQRLSATMQNVKAKTIESTTVLKQMEDGSRQLVTTITGVNKQHEHFTRIVTMSAEAGKKFNENSKREVETLTQVLTAQQKLNLAKEEALRIQIAHRAVWQNIQDQRKETKKRIEQEDTDKVRAREKQYSDDQRRAQTEERAKEDNYNRDRKRAQIEERAKEDNYNKDRKRHITEEQARNENFERRGRAHMQERTHHRKRERDHVEALRMNKDFNASLKKQTGAVGAVSIAWKSFGRLIALRAIAGFIFRIKSEVIQLTKAFASFNKGVAEIQTIITPEEQTVKMSSEISDRIVRVAAQNNIELSDSVNAFYANLSNQVSNNLAGLELFTLTAIRLSKATVSTLEDSGNAISSVIQAYNLSFSDAERVSASLFKTVDEGRVRLTEMANTIGTIGVPAHALGITFNETNAAVGRLTLQGIKFNRASTLLRNVFLKLLKPTEKLKELYQSWGVETGQQAIQAFGLSGVLVKLHKEAERGAHVLPELFSRIRASIGAQGLAGTAENVEEYIKTLDKVSTASDEFNKAVELVTESAGEKFQRELNKTKTILIDTFGKAGVNSVNSLNDWIVELTGSTKTLGDVAAGAAKNMAVLIASMGTALLGAKLAIVAASNPLAALGLLAIGAIVTAIFNIATAAQKLRTELKRVGDAAKDAGTELTRVFIEDLSEATAKRLEELRNRTGFVLASIADKTALYKLQLLSVEKNLDAQEGILQAEIDRKKQLIEHNVLYKKQIPWLKEQLKIQENISKVAKDRAKTLAFGFEGSRFEREQRGQTDEQRINNMLNRSNDLARRARGAFASGDYDDGRKFIDEALSLLSKADQEQFDIFGTTKFEDRFTNLESLAIGLEKDAEAKASNAKAAFAKELAGITSNLEKDKAIIASLEGTLKDLQTIREDINTISQDQTLTEEEQNLKIRERIDLSEALIGKANPYTQALRDQLNINIELERLEARRKVEADRLLAAEQVRSKLMTVSTSLATARGEVAGGLNAAFDQAIAQAGERVVHGSQLFGENRYAFEFPKKFLDAQEEATRLQKVIVDGKSTELQKDTAMLRIRELIKDLQMTIIHSGDQDLLDEEGFQNILESLTGLESNKSQKVIEDLVAELEGLNKELEVLEDKSLETFIPEYFNQKGRDAVKDTTEAIKEQGEEAKRLERLKQREVQLETASTATGIDPEKMETFLASREEQREALAEWTAEQKKLADETKRAREESEAQETAAEELQNSTPKVVDVLGQRTTSWNNLGIKIHDAADGLDRINTKDLALKLTALSLSTATGLDLDMKAQGGSIFRRVGSDTVPAMLTPGEFVVNARSAQANIGLLNRINNSRTQNLARGGTVNTDNSTNTINLQSTSNESLDARRIQRALNKGKRRGTSSPRPRNFA